MLDAHCHLDRYRDPRLVASEAAKQGVFIIAVTNLPSHFMAGVAHVRPMRRVRLALGLHPLAANEHEREREQFSELLQKTSFVGEVGLDLSREGKATERIQLESFAMVASELASTPKFATIHSRAAEKETLALLQQHAVRPVVFHWYSGSLTTLDDALQAGHYFSVNPAMIASANGQRIISRIPKERLLTETDGPYTRWQGRMSTPYAVRHVEDYVGRLWNVGSTGVRGIVWRNFKTILDQLGLVSE